MQDRLWELFAAIADDDRVRTGEMLEQHGSLVARVATAGHYESRIGHWIYAKDTALHVAAAGYRVEIGAMLLQAGAEVNAARNHRRSRPLHYAADGSLSHPFWNPDRQAAMIRLLLAAGAEIDAPDKNGATALHHAVRARCAAAVKCLLQAKANVVVKNEAGGTPFHLAVQITDRAGLGVEKARAAQREVIQAFLEAGVSTELPDAKDRTVSTRARSPWIRRMLSGQAH